MKVFSLLLTLHAFLGNYWAEMNLPAGTLTTNAQIEIADDQLYIERVRVMPPTQNVIATLGWQFREDEQDEHAS